MASTLILTYGLGTGHNAVASVLSEELGKLGHSVAVSRLEDWVPLDYDLLFRRGYLLLALGVPRVWDWMYSSPRFTRKEAIAPFYNRWRTARAFGEKALGDADLVVACQYNAMEIAADWKKTTGSRVKLAVVLTDWDVYPLWIRPEVDLYVIPHPDLSRLLLERGVGEERIAATGLPVSPVFERPSPSASMTKAALGMERGSRTALILGGGGGNGPLRECAESVLSTEGWSAIVVCGNNDKLRRSFIPLVRKNPKKLRVLGYRDDMRELMEASDVVVTKGGGVSLAEALYAGKRVIIVKGLPGQEKINTAFMAERGWVVPCNDPGELPTALSAIVQREWEVPPLPPSPGREGALALHRLAGG